MLISELLKLEALFAGGSGDPEDKAPEPPNVEEDNVDEPDAENDAEDEDEYGLHKIFDEDDDDEDFEEDDEETEEEEETEETKPKPQGKTFTEDDVNRIVQERLARKERQFEDQSRNLNEKLGKLQSMTGMDIDQITTHVQHAQVRAKADEKGITEDEARHWLESEQKAKAMESEVQRMRQDQTTTQRMIQYDREKSKFLSDPRVKPFEAEIDEFAQNGLSVGFEPAMNYVLGKAMREGRIDLEKDVQQKTLASIRKKGKVSPEGGGSAGGGADSTLNSLSKTEKQLARNLGLSPQDFLASKKKLEKEKRSKKV